MSKEKQLKQNDDIFVANQKTMRELFEAGKISESDFLAATQFNIKQHDDVFYSLT